MLHVPFLDDLHLLSDRPRDPAAVSLAEGLTLLGGRFLFSLIFIVGGFNHYLDLDTMVEYAAANGVWAPELMVPLTGAMILLGGASVLLGYWARLGAFLLVLFLIPTTLIMHRFWGVADPMMAATQMAHFMKNAALTGGALLLIYFGPGPLSLDTEH